MIYLNVNPQLHQTTIYYKSQQSDTFHTSQGIAIFTSTDTNYTILGYGYHDKDILLDTGFIKELLTKNVNIVYVCTQLPINAIKHNRIIYVETGQRWFTHLLFKNPQEIKAVFYNRVTSAQVKAKLFAGSLGAEIPILRSSEDLPILKKISRSLEHDKTFLIESFDGMGDVLMSLPTAETLHSQGWKVQYLVEPSNTSIFDNLNFVDKVYTPVDQIPLHLIKSYVSLSGRLSEYGLDFNQQHRVYSTAYLCGLRNRDLVTLKPTIILSNKEKEEAKELLSYYKRTVGVCWESYGSDRSYFKDYTQQLCTNLTELGFTPVILGTQKFNFMDCVDLAGKTSMRQLFAIINELDYVITVDNGILHAAGALGKPTIALMGPIYADYRCSTYPECYPLEPDKKEIPCYPCMAKQWVPRENRKCNDSVSYCLRTIKPAKIIRMLQSIIDKEDSTSKDVNKPVKSLKEPSMLIRLTDGELGDKLVALGLVSELKRKYPKHKVDIYLWSERFNTEEGYFRLFRDCADNIYLNRAAFLKKEYDKKFTISARSIHKEELDDVTLGYTPISRYQRWSKKLGFDFRGKVRALYKVKREDGTELQKLKVIAISDSKTLLTSIRAHLEQENCNVLTSSSIEDALLLRRIGKLDLIIIDKKICNADNMNVIAKIKKEDPLLVTTVIAPQKSIKMSRVSNLDYLTKPIRKKDIKALVRKVNKVRQPTKIDGLKHPIIGISPITSNSVKDWEPVVNGTSSKWQELINYLSNKGCSVVTIHYSCLKYSNCLNFGHLNPNELGYVVSKLDLLIGSEAGISHFAGILDIPMLILVGASSSLVLRHYNNVRTIHKGRCRDCSRFISPSFSHGECKSKEAEPYSKCLESLTPKEVIEEIKNFKEKEFFKQYKCKL